MLLLMRRMGESLRINDDVRLIIQEVEDQTVTFAIENIAALPEQVISKGDTELV